MEILTLISTALLIAIGILFVVVGIPYLVMLGITARLRRRILERRVVGEIALVMRQLLPLSVGLSFSATSESGRVRRRLQAISHCLARGLNLTSSVQTGFPECPGIVLSLIRSGEECQQLPAALDQAEKLLEERERTRADVMPSALMYICGMSAGCALLLTIFMVVIAPKLEEIYQDFGVGQPPRGLVLFNPGLVSVLGVVLSVSLMTMIGAFVLRLRPRRTPTPSLVTRFADTIRWWTPGLRRLEKGHGLATMLRAMRYAILAGMDVGQAAIQASGLDVNWVLRQRMRRFGEAVNSGVSPQQAVLQARLGDVTALALQGGVRGGNMDSALRYAADYNDAVVSRFWSLITKLAWPLTTLAVGVLVGSAAIELMIPMIAVLNAIMYGAGLG